MRISFTQNTIEEWKIIFIIGGIAYILPAFIYFIFGSGERQSWNDHKHLNGENTQRGVSTVNNVDN